MATLDEYPITTIDEARQALSNVRAFGTPEQRQEVLRAIEEKYPGLRTRRGIQTK